MNNGLKRCLEWNRGLIKDSNEPEQVRKAIEDARVAMNQHLLLEDSEEIIYSEVREEILLKINELLGTK